MKKLLLGIAVFSVAIISAEAQRMGRPQGNLDPEKTAERMTERMSEKLSLSEEQKKEVYALHLERVTERAEERKAHWEKMKAENQADQEKLQSILTPEQKAQWEEIKVEARENRGHKIDGKRKFNEKKKRNWKQKGDA